MGTPPISLGDHGRPSPRLLMRLLKLIDAEQPDILHSYLPSANILAVLAKRLRPDLKVVWGLRLSESESRHYPVMHRITYWIERHLPFTADLMIANAPSVRKAAIASGLAADLIKVIPNGFDADCYQTDQEGRQRLRQRWAITDNERLIGMVGRLDPMKGHEVFFKAVQHLAEENSNLRFVCVGPDPYRRQTGLELLAQRLGLADRLTWESPDLSIRDVYSALDVLCHPSNFGEGFPNVIAEALLTETLCVATDIGHSGDLLRGVGVITAPCDPKALEAGLREVLQWSNTRSTRAVKEGRERVQNSFSVEALVTRTEDALVTLHERTIRPSTNATA